MIQFLLWKAIPEKLWCLILLSISFKNACEILDGRITEADALNPVFDKALATEIEMFLQMTDRNAIDEIQKLDLDNFDNNEIYLEDTDWQGPENVV